MNCKRLVFARCARLMKKLQSHKLWFTTMVVTTKLNRHLNANTQIQFTCLLCCSSSQCNVTTLFSLTDNLIICTSHSALCRSYSNTPRNWIFVQKITTLYVIMYKNIIQNHVNWFFLLQMAEKNRKRILKFIRESTLQIYKCQKQQIKKEKYRSETFFSSENYLLITMCMHRAWNA